MEWQNASATTRASTTPSAPRAQEKSSKVRTVVAPARRLQKAAKSLSPSSPALAWFITSTSTGSGSHTVSRRRTGSAVASESAIRYE